MNDQMQFIIAKALFNVNVILL